MSRTFGIALALTIAGSTAAASQAADTDTFVAPHTAEWAQCRDTLDVDTLSRFIVAREVLMQDTKPPNRSRGGRVRRARTGALTG